MNAFRVFLYIVSMIVILLLHWSLRSIIIYSVLWLSYCVVMWRVGLGAKE